MRHFPIRILAAAGVLAAAALAQAPTTKVIFLGDKSTCGGTGCADPAILKDLETWYGKANVTYQDTEPNGTVTASTILGYDVAVLSSTPSSGRYRNVLDKTPVPIVNFEEAVADTGGGEYQITSGRTKETEAGAHAITITAAHPITTGFQLNQKVTITNAAAEVWWSTGAQAPGATSLAADDDTPTNMYITFVDVGGTLLNGNKAECRRVMFGLTDGTYNSFTKDGKTLLKQAIDWAADGCCAQSSDFGTGLAGKNGIPTLTLSGVPKYRTKINLAGTNSSGAPSVGVLVFSKLEVAAPIFGGTLYTCTYGRIALPLAANGFTAPWSIPDSSALCGRVPRDFHTWYFQLLQLDPAATAGWSFTAGKRIELGK